MPDEADQAHAIEEHNRTMAQRQRHTTLPAVGKCHYCDELVDAGRRFCGRDCLEDFERIDAARKRGGVRT